MSEMKDGTRKGEFMNMMEVKKGDVLRNTISGIEYLVYSVYDYHAGQGFSNRRHIGARKVGGGRHVGIGVPDSGLLKGWMMAAQEAKA